MGIALREWFRPPRLVLTLFLGLMCVCALALAWLGWKFIEQDRQVEAQRAREHLESAADRVVAALDRTLHEIANFAAARNPGPGEVFVAVSEASVEIIPRGSLAFSPWWPADPTAEPNVFREAEQMEFSRRDLEKAVGTYRRLAGSKLAPVRAGALVRLGRILRSQHHWRQALDAYDELAKLGSLPVAGMPAGLVAQAARCSVLEESGQPQALRERARELWADLAGGRWVVSRPTLDTYTDELRRWTGTLPLPPDWNERLILAQAVGSAWEAREADGGRWFHFVDGSPVSIFWWNREGVWYAHLAGPSFWRRVWTGLERDTGMKLDLAGGRAKGPSVFRAAAATGLPWNITVAPEGRWTMTGAAAARRRLFASAFAVFALLLAAGTYIIMRAMLRELAVARLQSDFIAAVSHEFRTPLTSIRQLTEMLARGRVDTAEQVQRAYDLMMTESDRLKRLVESLLDFGRMQTGAFRFQFEYLDAREWARSVVEQFGDTVRSRDYAVEFTSSVDGARIRADREALAGALWNLLDNAVKYSPDHKSVGVDVAPGEGAIEIRVRDRGIGIASEDVQHIFEKFYRGGNARQVGVKGVGIGLAIVREIVKAHGGEVRLESTPADGTVFTIALPAQEKP